MPGLMNREYDLTPIANKTLGEVFGKKARVNTFMKKIWGLLKDPANKITFVQK